MPTVVEERDELRKLLRKVCNSGVALPSDVLAWWAAEQVDIATQQAQRAIRVQARRDELNAKISALQAELASL